MRRFVSGVVSLLVLCSCGPEPSTAPTSTTAMSQPATTPATSSTQIVTTTTVASPTSTSTVTTTAPPPSSTTTAQTREYVSAFPDGMSCRDFATEELGWFVALGYWFVNGQPSYLDADGDGLPCEDIPFPIIHEDGTAGTIIWGENLWIDLMRPGMYCRDFVVEEDHPPYWSAVLYWLSEGEPDRMDADRDGIPCETTYPEVFIRDLLEDPTIIGNEDPTIDELDRGLRCRDLIWWMPFYQQALGYFYSEGFPERMDADDNGVPCETVYSDATLITEDATSFADGIRTTYPENLSCAELADPDIGGFYPAVAMYWLIHGRPSELDPDGDGYPCSPGWPRPEEVEFFKEGSPGCCAG